MTAWELKKEKIPATLVTDNMAGYLMQKGKVDAVVVGCDRVAANGDVANKIGTYTHRRTGETTRHSILCGRDRLPRLILTVRPEKISPSNKATQKKYPICSGRALAPKGTEVFNPAFDVTSQDLISAIITEKGVIRPPYQKNIRSHVSH